MKNESPAVTLSIEGMDCANCALGITRKLVKSGNEDVHVNFATGEANLRLGQGQTIDRVVSDIEGLGYHVIGRPDKAAAASGRFGIEAKFWFCLVFTIPLFFGHMLFSHDAAMNQPLVQLLLCSPVFAVGAWHFGRSAWGSLKSGVPNMDVLILIGSSSAFIYSLLGYVQHNAHEAHEYLFFETAATIITLVLLGNLIEHRSVKRTTTAISELTKLQPETARRVEQHGDHEHVKEVPVTALQYNDILQVNTGDRIPADGVVLAGEGAADESMISGESLPVDKVSGAPVIGGTLLQSGSLRMRVERTGSETVLAGIIKLVKQAQQDKPAIQQLGDRVSAIFVPAVLGVAVITFLISAMATDMGWQTAMMHAIAVLVISCPCAMGLATPTAVMVGVGRAARRGILIRGGRTLEELARTQYIVFDKTGTLTTGRFRIRKFEVREGVTEAEARAALLGLEQRSSHPIARSLTEVLQQAHLSPLALSLVMETKGLGMSGRDEQRNRWEAGSFRIAPEGEARHDVYLLKNGTVAAVIDLEDELKAGAADLIRNLEARGIQTVLLSGDSKTKCEAVAAQLGIRHVFAEQKPEEKTAVIKSFCAKGKTVMVGDGVNDAPALAAADIGISMGDATQAAIAQAQVVLLGKGDLGQLGEALRIGQHSLLTIRQNLFWAFFYNVVAIPVAAIGLLSPMVAALSMAFSDVVVIGNSIRLRTKKLS